MELFSFTWSGRRSNEVESRPTTSSGTSTRSSICCAGEAARLSMERNNNNNNNNRSSISSGGPLTSFVNLSFPFATVKRSNHGRNGSIKSNRSSLQLFNTSTFAPATTTTTTAAIVSEPASFLDMDNSLTSAEDDVEEEPSPASSHSLPSPFTPSPQTPSDAVFDNFTTEKQSGYNNGLGLTMMFDRPFESQEVIVESPTGEDLASLVVKQEEEAKEEVIDYLPQKTSKFSSSPLMPMLNRDFVKASDDEEGGNKTTSVISTTSTPLRFATFTKFAARRTGMSPIVKPIQLNKTSSLPLSPPKRARSPFQRPSTATGIRSSVSKSNLFS